MIGKRRKTKVSEKSVSFGPELNEVSTQNEITSLAETSDDIQEQNESIYTELFELSDKQEFIPDDFLIDVPIDSIESSVGYSSLFRQMHQAFIKRVAFYRSKGGGALSIEEAREKAFHPCTNASEAQELFESLMRVPLENLNFVDLFELHSFAPRVAERFWERAKREGRNEFESGHLGAHTSFPVDYMKSLWNIARYLGVRESFIDEWKPKGGIEIALIDMLAQSYFQWQYWLEQSIKRTKTPPRREHPEYQQWKQNKLESNKTNSWQEGYWFPPYISEQQAVEQAVQTADRWNRIFTRTLRQLRDLRRYSPVTINNPNQVNIAADGGKQINLNER